jgi:gluconate 2-dehydrogenase gamma chain
MSSRRDLFRGAAALPAVAALPAAAQTAPEAGTVAAWQAGNRDIPPHPPYRFLQPAEAAFVEAAVDLLIPADDQWPGALWAGVPGYIDGQLVGPYGRGARFYKEGPWAEGLPTQGYQLRHNPSELYRVSLAAILQAMPDFAQGPPERREALLREVEAGRVDCGGFPSSVFFETLLSNTIEGWFADPAYGGNRDMVSWRMIGFPGAHAAYLNIYTAHGRRYDEPPMAMGEVGAHQHDAILRAHDLPDQGQPPQGHPPHGHAPAHREGGQR